MMKTVKKELKREDKYGNPMPLKGDTYEAYGQLCTIVKVYPFGTMDIVTPKGKYFRVTGLPWFVRK